jgi:hypothetical protein
MTRRSKRGIEQAVDDLGESGEFTIQEYLLASLKNYYDGHLSERERALLENPETHLSASAVRRLENIGGPQ